MLFRSPTVTLLVIPAPPATSNAPDVVVVDTVELVILTFPNDAEFWTTKLPLIPKVILAGLYDNPVPMYNGIFVPVVDTQVG